MNKKKKKILHVSYGGLGSGGVSSVILSIVSSLYNLYDFHCVVFRKEGERECIFKKYGSLHRINCYFVHGFHKIIDVCFRPFKMTYTSYLICKKENIDIIHCHNGNEEAYFLLGARLAGVKKRIAHSHNSLSPQKTTFVRQIYDSIHRFLIIKLATHFVGCSEEANRAFFRKGNCIIINNSINLKKFPWKRNAHKGFVILQVGRFDYQKNQEFSINVVNELYKRGADVKLRLVGFGADEEKLKSKTRELGLENIITFVDGNKANIHEEYANADIMLLPSFYEGFGIVLIEAQSTGCYVFASDVVPSCTNVGMMTSLSLHLGESEWADRILSFAADKPKFTESDIVAINQFSDKFISEKYIKLYEE